MEHEETGCQAASGISYSMAAPSKPDKAEALKWLRSHVAMFGAWVVAIRATPYVLHLLSGKKMSSSLNLTAISFYEDMLRALAEVLGKGNVGTSYKAMLEEGTTVVVKRLKDIVITKREFEMTMEVLGKIKHNNMVPLCAFYFSKYE
ncbi:hypothetical protein ACFXTI_006544 [Malus domestica]